MDGVEGGGRSGRAAMGRPGTRHHFDQFRRRLRGHWRAAIRGASLVRLLPSLSAGTFWLPAESPQTPRRFCLHSPSASTGYGFAGLPEEQAGV